MDDPGGGPYDPQTGLRDWYFPAADDDTEDRPSITWSEILENWASLEADFHSEFDIDLESGVMRERTWRWFQVRMSALLNDPTSRLARSMTHIPAPEPHPEM